VHNHILATNASSFFHLFLGHNFLFGVNLCLKNFLVDIWQHEDGLQQTVEVAGVSDIFESDWHSQLHS